MSEAETVLRKQLKLKCLGLASLEWTIARTRLRLVWLKEGDANTSFFHINASCRRKKNCIRRLKVDELVSTDQDMMENIAFEFFEAKLGVPVDRVIIPKSKESL